MGQPPCFILLWALGTSWHSIGVSHWCEALPWAPCGRVTCLLCVAASQGLLPPLQTRMLKG